MSTDVPPEQVPGYLPAVRAVAVVMGDSLSGASPEDVALAALAAAVPHIKVEVLSDLADDLATGANYIPPGHPWREPLIALSNALDASAAALRKELES